MTLDALRWIGRPAPPVAPQARGRPARRCRSCSSDPGAVLALLHPTTTCGYCWTRLVVAANLTATDGTRLRFTPHDFRRIFATEAVGSGLPIHIAGKLLGHQTLATTQIYVAVYDNDIVEHYRAFLTRRRTLRPSEEYCEPTDAEWDDFLGHFVRRKVELGVCGRAYGTPCQHEDPCVRCPMLRPDPAQQHRLEEMLANLHARITETHVQGWHGEIEGLEFSLGAADQKLASMLRTSTGADLGMPIIPWRQPETPR